MSGRTGWWLTGCMVVAGSIPAVVTPGAAQCSIGCSAVVPAIGTAGAAVRFAAVEETDGCSGSAEYEWDFGDGSSTAIAATTSHVYQEEGAYPWKLTIRAEGISCEASGVILIGEGAEIFRYFTFGARNPGKNGTYWTSDLCLVNVSNSDAAVTVLLVRDSGTVQRTATLAVNATREWRDVVASLFGIGGDASGAVLVESSAPLFVSTRINTPFGGGVMGQWFPAAALADAIERGVEGFLPQLRGTADYRTNVGFLNLGDYEATLSVHLANPSGGPVGNGTVVAVPPRGWFQINDVFAAVGAGATELAYARIQVHTSGTPVWAYGSVVQQTTGDPATIVMMRR